MFFSVQPKYSLLTIWQTSRGYKPLTRARQSPSVGKTPIQEIES